MVINGISINFTKLVNKTNFISGERKIPLVLIKEDREYIIFPYSEDTFMLSELSGEEDASYSIINYGSIVWSSDNEFELHGSKYRVSSDTIKALTEMNEDELKFLS